MNRMKRYLLVALGVMAGGLLIAAAHAGDIENQGRAVLEKNQKGVVTVQLVIKQKFSASGMGSEENELKEEATGFVIDPSGLTVLSLFETDPASLYENMMGGEGMAEQFKMETTLGDVKLLLEDGKEIPARVVLRDKDLDLAFVRPVEKPAEPLAALDLTQAAEPLVLDQLIALTRLGKVAGRVCSANLERIHAIVRKPRTFYVPGNDPTHSGLGSPVFTLDGKLVGMIGLRTIREERKGPMGFLGGMGEGMMAVVVPAADVLEAAKQAPAADAKPKE
jgi:S1-C subfamily serine protease